MVQVWAVSYRCYKGLDRKSNHNREDSPHQSESDHPQPEDEGS